MAISLPLSRLAEMHLICPAAKILDLPYTRPIDETSVPKRKQGGH